MVAELRLCQTWLRKLLFAAVALGVPTIVVVTGVSSFTMFGTQSTVPDAPTAAPTTLIDTKGQKLTAYHGKTDTKEYLIAYKLWRFKTLNYFGAIDPQLAALLRWSEEQGVPLQTAHMNEGHRKTSASLSFLLSQALTDAALSKQMEVEDNNGLEIWRVLYRAANRHTGTKWSTMMTNIRNIFFRGAFKVYGGVYELAKRCRRLRESYSGEYK